MPASLPLILFSVGAAVCLILLRVAAAKAVSPHPDEEMGILWLRFNPLYKAFHLAAFIASAVAVVLFSPFGIWAEATALAVSLWRLFTSISAIRFQIGLSESTLFYGHPFRKKEAIPWEAIRAVTFSYPQKGWFLETQHHGKYFLPTSLSGTPALFEAMEKRNIPLQ